MKSQHPNGIRIEGDSDVHRPASVCSVCTPGWPLPHSCGGNVHAEKRWGRMLSISEFQNGRWVSSAREDADCKTIVGILNWLLESATGSERIGTELEYLEQM